MQAQKAQHGPRPCPPDFDATYVAHGKDACESIYRATSMTVRRWVHERGAERLRADRAAYVAECRLRAAANRAAEKARRRTNPADNVVMFAPALVRSAADYLRHVRNGGWVICTRGPDSYCVGTRRMTGAELVAFAERKGYAAPAEVQP